MARKLRLEVGDWVMCRPHKAVGRVYDVSLNNHKEYHKWGVYEYKIAWKGDWGPSPNGWTIRNLSEGMLVHINNPNSVEVLYGKA